MACLLSCDKLGPMREPSQLAVVTPTKQQRRPATARLAGHLGGGSPSSTRSTKATGLLTQTKNKCFSEEEEELLIKLHALLGNRWSLIAGRLPGRTEKEVKNHCNSRRMRTKLKRRGVVEPDGQRSRTLPSPEDEQRRRRRQGNEPERPAKRLDRCASFNGSNNVDQTVDVGDNDAGGCCRARQELAQGLNLELTLSTPCLCTLYKNKEQVIDS
ncbi:hypothetical protein ACP70R_030388 [Stipagrostis hirtigluma subsp. patula]